MASPSLRLSKSRFLAGLQCHKQLWWRVHEPDAPELVPDAAHRNILDQGNAVGRKAREYIPGGTLVDLPFHEFDNRVARTREVRQCDPALPAIYEATFLADETYAAVDILERGPRGYGVVEVKATNSLKPQHLPDVAVQVHVLRHAGLPVERAAVMHLNPDCRYPDLGNLFVREDVSALVEGVLLGVSDELAAQHRMLEGPLPDVAIGDHCSRPHDCPFIERCWPKLPQHHVSSLYRIERKQVREYEADGYATLYDLPSDLELSAIHARQVRAVTAGRMVVEPALAKALAGFTSPLAFLDFETVSLAIPRWNGCRPWQNVPVQFSCHAEERGRGLVHHEWLADGPGDSRPALAEAAGPACEGARKVVAYYASFERDCIRQLAEAVPRLAKELQRIEKKLVDLLPLVRNHVYHPEFGGSFSIKRTRPARVPGLAYADLKSGEGEAATPELMRLMFSEAPQPAERVELREALLRYCERDTWAMVKMLAKLRTLVAEQLELF